MKLGFYYKEKFYINVPKAIQGIGAGLQKLSNEQLIELGAKEIVEPILEKYQTKGTPYYDDSDNKIKFNVVEKFNSTQEIYDYLTNEMNAAFSEFELDLSKVSAPYNILNNHPQGLKDLTQMLLSEKARIKSELETALENEDLETLKAYSFNTEQNEQLKQAINQFR